MVQVQGEEFMSHPKKQKKEKDGIKMNGQDSSNGADFDAEKESSVDSTNMETDGSDDADATSGDDLEDLFLEMDLAMETAKENEEVKSKASEEEYKDNDDEDDICVHSSILNDELGLVCRICGLIEKPIESIFSIIGKSLHAQEGHTVQDTKIQQIQA